MLSGPSGKGQALLCLPHLQAQQAAFVNPPLRPTLPPSLLRTPNFRTPLPALESLVPSLLLLGFSALHIPPPTWPRCAGPQLPILPPGQLSALPQRSRPGHSPQSPWGVTAALVPGHPLLPTMQQAFLS